MLKLKGSVCLFFALLHSASLLQTTTSCVKPLVRRTLCHNKITPLTAMGFKRAAPQLSTRLFSSHVDNSARILEAEDIFSGKVSLDTANILQGNEKPSSSITKHEFAVLPISANTKRAIADNMNYKCDYCTIVDYR